MTILPLISGVLLLLALGALVVMLVPRAAVGITRPEVWFVAFTALLAISYAFWKAPGSVVAAPVSKEKGCGAIRREMTSAQLETAAGEPAEIVLEVDTRGPGAEAWVYAESRCVAHVLDGRVRWVDYE